MNRRARHAYWLRLPSKRQPQPGPKFDYKLAWFKTLANHAKRLLSEDVPVILAGDYNVAPTEQDIYQTHSWDNDALVQPESRDACRKLLKQGWTDAIRVVPLARDAGLRLDHILLSPTLAERLSDAGVDRVVRQAQCKRSCAGVGRTKALGEKVRT